MSVLSRIAYGCRVLFRKKKLEAERAEEMRDHLMRCAEAKIASGLPPDEARYAALRQFGGVEQIKEMAREGNGLLWLEHLIRDVRFSLRGLRKNPGFTTVAVLSLGLGIGACTTVFSLANAILLRSLPVPDPQELRVLQWTGVNPRIRSLHTEPVISGGRITADAVSMTLFLRLREKSAALADIFGFFPLAEIAVGTQIGLSLLLLSGAGLFVRTLANLRGIEAGFDLEKLLVFRLNPSAAGYNPVQRTAFYEQVQTALAAIPGVQGASLLMHPLLDNAENWGGGFSFPSRTTVSPGSCKPIG